jgi:hypothetical protein
MRHYNETLLNTAKKLNDICGHFIHSSFTAPCPVVPQGGSRKRLPLPGIIDADTKIRRQHDIRAVDGLVQKLRGDLGGDAAMPLLSVIEKMSAAISLSLSTATHVENKLSKLWKCPMMPYAAFCEAEFQ